jgi:hypothetical protein
LTDALIPGPSQIGFQWCAFDSTFGAIIDWGTQASVGHVDIILPSNHPRAGDLIGAQHETGLGGMPAGVQIRPAGYVKASGGYNLCRALLSTTPEVAAAAYEWVLSMQGTPYDIRAIEGIAAGENWSTEGKLICSGTASGMLTQPSPSFIGHQLPRPWRIITPEQHMILCAGFSPVVPVS